MNSLKYQFNDELPALGAAKKIDANVKWLRMPLPFALDHINLWLIKDDFNGRHGWTVVDCGAANQATKDAWESIFQSELEGLPMWRVS